MCIKITNSFRGKMTFYATQAKQRIASWLNMLQPIRELWLKLPNELRAWLRFPMMVVLIVLCLMAISGCATRTVAITPPALLMLERSCADSPQTYREALIQLENCKAANAGHQNDKHAIEQFYKGLK